ncbi:MAG TPA: regulatory protein RecX [Anaerolineales bacterium]|nr:regulatory protein RecX [Anaerolineales bacterium]
MATITALRIMPRRRGRVAVYVDGRLRLMVDPAVAASLSIGLAFDEATLADLQGRQAVEAGLQKAGRLLARRPRSEFELRTALRKSGGSDETVEAVVDRLKDAGQIDDERFARTWLEDRAAFRPRSALGLRAELQRKGLRREIVDQALSGFSEDEAAVEAARRAVRRWRGADEAERRRRMVAYLQRRGFGHETITAAVRRVTAESAASGESEGEL